MRVGLLGFVLERDQSNAEDRLRQMPHDHPMLRPYQLKANAAVENALAERKRNLLVAMALCTGKTFTIVNQIYPSTASTPSQSSSSRRPTKSTPRFQREDFAEEERFDPQLLFQGYLTEPQPGHVFVYVATIQRMAVNILGRQAIFSSPDQDTIDDDADRLDIPIHAFDLVVADECHRDFTSQELSVWRDSLDHFAAVRIGLTATPAATCSGAATPSSRRSGHSPAQALVLLRPVNAISPSTRAGGDPIRLDPDTDPTSPAPRG